MERDKVPEKKPSKFIARGAYGCVFRPAVPCSNGPSAHFMKMTHVKDLTQSPYRGKSQRPISSNSTIGKVFKNTADFKDEVAAFASLSKRINTENRFSPRFIKQCNVDTSNLDPLQKQQLKKCAFLGEKNEKKKGEKKASPSPSASLPQIVMEDGGTPLDEIQTNFLDIFFSSKPLFEAISSLQKNKKCHLDIKEANVVYNKENDRMLLIDYGFMMDFKDLYTKVSLDTNYSSYPPEFRFAQFVLSAKSSPDLEQRVEFELLNPLKKDLYIDTNYTQNVMRHALAIMKEVKKLDGNKNNIKLIVAKFDPESRNKELSSFASYFFKLYNETAKKHISMSKRGNLTERKKELLMLNIFRDELTKKIDSHALGMMFISMLGKSIQNKSTHIQDKTTRTGRENHTLMSSILSLVQRMSHANPFERLDAIEAHDRYMELYNKYERK